MSFAKPQISTPAAAPAPIDQGADALQVGGGDTASRTRGALGRLALRVGNTAGTSGTNSTTGA